MERPSLCPVDPQVPKSGSKLPRGTGRERHSEHLCGRDMALSHQISDTVCDRSGLPRARARKDAHRATRSARGRALFRVEPFERIP